MESQDAVGDLVGLPKSVSMLPTASRFSQVGELEIQISAPTLERPKSDRKRTRSHVVQSVRRTAHVTYDENSKSFRGLPKEWESELNKQFGLPPNLVARVRVSGYDQPIPTFLINMFEYLVAHEGLEVKGIFRLAPDAGECKVVKEQLDAGTFTECSDVNCISNLIKVWFRDLPRTLLASISHQSILTCRVDSDVQTIFDGLEEPNKSILLWLLDMCGKVSSNAEVNLMSPKNMAIVMTPNLYKPPEITPGMSGEDQMNVMMLCKKFTEFFEKAIEYRLKQSSDDVNTLTHSQSSV